MDRWKYGQEWWRRRATIDIVIDGAAGDEYEAAQGFPRWYGPDGAEHYMRADSIARSFQWVPVGAMQIDRANAMEQRSAPPEPVAQATDPRGNAGEI